MAGRAGNKGWLKGFDYKGLAAFMLGSLVLGSIGAIATSPKIATWYATLAKPSFTPPNWVFAPVWTILFLLMGAAAFLVWKKRERDRRADEALVYFGIQFLFNIAWSFAFFGAESPLYGMSAIAFLDAAVLVTAWKFWRVDRNAGLLLIPYIAWLALATALNYYVLILNT